MPLAETPLRKRLLERLGEPNIEHTTLPKTQAPLDKAALDRSFDPVVARTIKHIHALGETQNHPAKSPTVEKAGEIFSALSLGMEQEVMGYLKKEAASATRWDQALVNNPQLVNLAASKNNQYAKDALARQEAMRKKAATNI